jgi:hypothetical protein
MLERISRVKTLNNLASYASAISAAWHKSVENTLEAATLCAEADKELSSQEKAQLIEQLPFEAPTFSKLVKIGNDPRLRSEEMRPRLPPSFSTLYEIALCSDTQLERALVSGALHPGATRSDIEVVRKAPRRPKRATLQLFGDGEPKKNEVVGPQSKIERMRFAEVHVPIDFSPEQGERLEEELTRVAESYGISVVRCLTIEERAEQRYGKAFNAFVKRWESIGRRLARQRINELKRQTRKRNKKWGFAPDETELDGQGWDRIEEVFNYVGLEDEFEDLRAEAEALANAPELPAELSNASSTHPDEFELPKKKRLSMSDFADWNCGQGK